jgi:hypothetical protein
LSNSHQFNLFEQSICRSEMVAQQEQRADSFNALTEQFYCTLQAKESKHGRQSETVESREIDAWEPQPSQN